MSQISTVPGLRYLPRYLEAAAEERLIQIIDAQPWRSDLARRVQHYGYRYSYKARRADPSMYLGPLPLWLLELAQKLHAAGLFEKEPDQAIINEYQPGQGIGRHIDCVPCFGPTVASLSLGSACIMELIPPQGDPVVPLLLEPGSLVVLAGPAREEWQHRIPARKREERGGQVLTRGRRISVTFRTLRLPG
jgi:alkylated DNA repair dioxygenase AlkB